MVGIEYLNPQPDVVRLRRPEAYVLTRTPLPKVILMVPVGNADVVPVTLIHMAAPLVTPGCGVACQRRFDRFCAPDEPEPLSGYCRRSGA